MSNKVIVVLDEGDLMMIERIRIDRDPEEALQFVLENLVKKVRKKESCADTARQLYRHQG